MSRLRPFDRCVRWATLLALVLATLAPGVAHALRHLRGDAMPWSQLCSATGSRRVVFEVPGDDGALARPHAFEQCSYCALHHDGQMPSTRSDSAPALRADLAHAVPTLFLQAPRPLPAWQLAPSRAPPAQA